MPQQALHILRNVFGGHPFRLYGLCLQQTWAFFTIRNLDFFAQRAALTLDIDIMRAVICVAFVTGLIGWMILGKERLLQKRPLFINAGIAFLSTVVLTISASRLSSLTLFALALIAISVSNAYLVLSWGKLWSELKPGKVVSCLLVSCVFSYFICGVILLLHTDVIAMLVSILPILAVLKLDYDRKVDALEATEGEPVLLREALCPSAVTKLFLAIFVISLLLGMKQALVFQYMPENPAFRSFYMATVFLVLLILSSTMSKDDPFVIRVYRGMIACSIIGFALFPFSSSYFHWMPLAIVSCGAPIIEQLVWIFRPEITLRIGGRDIRLFGWATVCIHVLSAVGFVVTHLIFANLQVSSAYAHTIVGIIGISLLTLLVLYILTEKDLHLMMPKMRYGHVDAEEAPQGGAHSGADAGEAAGEAAPQGDGDAGEVARETVDACAKAAEVYALSERELDILRLLSAGRTVPFVAEKLLLSQSTVKTHIKHIYGKMDIHNRQELHDKLETLACPRE